MLRRTVALVSATSTLLSVLACDVDECAEGDFKCEDDAAWTCVQTPTPTGGKLAWDGSACAEGLCRTDGEQAFCTLSAEPDAQCSNGSYCDDDVRINCIAGYLVREMSCSVCRDTAPQCRGFLGASCTEPTGCADGLSCDNGKCSQSCSCADDASCPECTLYSASATTVPVCRAGWCGAINRER